ncbi:MAG: transposase [Sterolibacteriaceae bacterium]|nr:transposase [Sterolibacteriaceae bacterium]
MRALSKVFRGKFVAGLDLLRSGGRLPASLGALSDWESLKRRLYAHDWVVYAKQPLGGPAQVLDYLGRYTHRVAISNERIVGIEGNEVLLRVRADPAAGARRTVRIPGPAFIHRFLQHVLPAGFKRIRHYGLLSPARKKDGLAAARAALGAPCAAGRDRVGGRVPASRFADRARSLPELRDRAVSSGCHDRRASSPASSARTAVRIPPGLSVAQRSDGITVRGLAHPRRTQQRLRSRHFASQLRPRAATPPLAHIGAARTIHIGHAIRLTSGATALQSP